MTTIEAILAISNMLTGVGWFKSYRDARSVDVSFWKETIEYQGKVIAELRSELDAAKEQIKALKAEVHRYFSPTPQRPIKVRTARNGDTN
jgi:hypothetical protein